MLGFFTTFWNTRVRENLICGGPMFHKCRFIVTTECKGSEFSSTRACFSGFCYVNVLLMNVLPLNAFVRH